MRSRHGSARLLVRAQRRGYGTSHRGICRTRGLGKLSGLTLQPIVAGAKGSNAPPCLTLGPCARGSTGGRDGQAKTFDVLIVGMTRKTYIGIPHRGWIEGEDAVGVGGY
jgi:hypothetical protein